MATHKDLELAWTTSISSPNRRWQLHCQGGGQTLRDALCCAALRGRQGGIIVQTGRVGCARNRVASRCARSLGLADEERAAAPVQIAIGLAHIWMFDVLIKQQAPHSKQQAQLLPKLQTAEGELAFANAAHQFNVTLS
jgi:hypothetical protein